jgi:hypothetical protein
MADPLNQSPIAIPVSQSPVSLASIVAIISTASVFLPSLASKLGLTSADAINSVAGEIYTVTSMGVTLVSSVIALIARMKSKVQPVTLTQAGADAKIAASPKLTTGTTK